MATLNVKIPDEMEEDLETYLQDYPHYLNKSELVRDALRHMLEGSKLHPPSSGRSSAVGSRSPVARIWSPLMRRDDRVRHPLGGSSIEVHISSTQLSGKKQRSTRLRRSGA